MADIARLEEDLREYLAKEKNFLREEKIKYLMVIFQKHLGIDNLTHAISTYDLHTIVSVANRNVVLGSATLDISGEKISGHNPMHVFMIEAMISYLNQHGLLNRRVGFDYDKK